MWMITALTAVLALAPSSLVDATPLPSKNISKRAGTGKRGLTWTFYNSPLDPRKFNTGGPTKFIYDYETFLPPSVSGAGGLTYIGMQRCMDCQSSPIAKLQAQQKQLGFQTLFTLNEPDINGISPPTAAAWYKQNINPLRIQKALPAVTSSTDAGKGLDWLKQMLDACAGACFFDYINLHHYGPNFDAFKNHVLDAKKRFPGKKIVITEFALQNPAGGQAAQVAFYKQAFAFLDNEPAVAMYFPFVATSPALLQKNDANGAKFAGTGSTLFNDDGSVSAVGQLMLK